MSLNDSEFEVNILPDGSIVPAEKKNDWCFEDFKNNVEKQESNNRDVSVNEAANIFTDEKVHTDLYHYKNLTISKKNSPRGIEIISTDEEGNYQGMYTFHIGIENNNSVYAENIHREVITKRGIGIGSRDMQQIEEIFAEIKKTKKLNVAFSTGNGNQKDTIEWLKKRFSYVFDEINNVMTKEY